ncbi:MAG: lantibiotic dehydratase [Cyclobacteriaceae bacterium]
MKLFPYSLIRIGGESFEDWDKLDAGELAVFFKDLNDSHDEKDRLKNQLCDDLMEFIRKLEDPAVQNAIQNVRRDIFNDRKVKNSKLQKAREILSDPLRTQLDAYLTYKEELKQKEEDGRTVYDKVARENRQVFKELVSKDSIKKGLVLSSRSLMERLESYYKRDIDQFRKKELQTEISLLQYLTRMYAKTSPFSTFTNLATVKTDAEAKSIDLNHEKNADEVIGHIRLNNFLLKYLFDLFINYEALYTKLAVRNNPTIQTEAESYLYLTNNNNIEAFQRIPQNPVVEYIYELVRADKSGIPFGNLVDQLLEAIDAERAEIEDYVKQLIDYGFLEYNMGVSGIDPDWDRALIAELEQMKDVPHISDLIDTLNQMRALSVAYAGKPSHERGAVLQEAFDAFKAVCFKLHEAAGLPEDERKSREELIEIQKQKDEERKQKEAEEKEKEEEAKKQAEAEGKEPDDEGKKEEEDAEGEKQEEVFKKSSSTFFTFKPEQIFYEDTTRQIDGNIAEEKANALIGKLYEVLQQMRVFQGTNPEKGNMKKYFIDKYGADASVDLLTYYEDYFREFKKPEKEKERKLQEEREKAQKEEQESAKEVKAEERKPEEKKSEEKKDNRNPTLIAWEKKFQEKLTLNGSDEINIGIDIFKEINEELGISTQSDRPASYGCFIQLMQNNGEISAFVNATFSGYGKMLSRFLHILGDEVTEKMRDWNKDLILKDELYIENCDASYFNANLHPTLMPNEIWMPGGHNSLPEEQQIPILDFKIAYDKEEETLKLIHAPTGKRSWVFDLGFQGHQGRSQLFQLLDKFTKADYLFTYPVTGLTNTKYGELQKKTVEKEEGTDEKPTPTISFTPRISIEDLIFQRKTWLVPKVMLPMKESTDDAYSYHKKVALWRRSNNLPDEVFIYVDPSRGANVPAELKKRLTRDDYKPQYIDFRQPLLVNLFEKLAHKTPQSMKIVEMLPTSEQMLKIDDKRYVSEFVMQWYNN